MVKVNLVFQLLAIFVSGSLGFNLRYNRPKIVGGKETGITSHPYQISLLQSGTHICGGSIISPEFVISAAHCTSELEPSMLQVRVGSSIEGYGGIVHKVEKIIQHPNYIGTKLSWDYSLLKLEKPIEFSEDVQPVLLPKAYEQEVVGSNAIVSGWGETKNPMETSKTLRAVTIKILDRKKCEDAYKKTSYAISRQMFCAGSLEGGKDSCQGDSGGPLVTKMNNGSMKLMGVVSWGMYCAEKGYPGVYAKVSMVRPWIKKLTGV